MATPRWLRWSAIGLAGLLLVLAVGLALGVAWLRTEAGNARVSGLAATALGRALGLELELGKIELRGRRVTIGPIAVRDPAADSTAVPLMQVAAVRGEITWTRLLLRRVQVRSLVIDRPVITLPRSASGAIQWPKLGRERSAPSGSGSRLVRLAIEELALENGRLLVAAPPSGGRPVTIDSLNLRASAELDFAKPATRITLEDFTGVWREGNLALDSAAARLVAGALGGSLASDLQLSTTPWRFELAASPITLELGAQANRGRVVLDAPRLPAGGLASLHPALARLPELGLHLQAEGPLDLAGKLPIALELQTIGARATLVGEIESPRHDPGLTVTKLLVSDLDPARLDPRAPAGRLTLAGTGAARRTPTGVESTFELAILSGSRLRDQPVSGKVSGRLSGGVWTIDRLGLELAQVRVSGRGRRAADGRLGAQLELAAPDVAPLSTFLGIPLAGDLAAQLRAEGPPSALQIGGSFESQALAIPDQVIAHGVSGTLELRHGKSLSARVSAIADSVRAPRAGAHLHQVELAVAADPHTGGVTDLSCRLVAETALLDRTAVPPGPLTLAAHGRKTNGTIAATIDTLALAGVAELQAPLAIRHRQRVLTLEGLDLAVAGGRVQGGFTQEPGRRGITCDLEEIDLAQVVALAGLDSVTSPSAADTTRRPAIAGRLSAKLALTDPGSGLLGKLALQGEELVLGAWPTPPLALALTSEVAPSTVVCNLQLAADDDSLVVRGTIPITRPNQVPHLAWDSPALDLEVHAAGDSLTPYLGRVLATIANTQPFAERLRKRLATTDLNLAVHARGRPRDPAIEVALDLDLAPLSPLGPGSLHLTAKRPADTLAVAAELAVEGMAAPLTLTAQAPLAMDLEQRAVAVPKTAPIAGTLDLSGFDLRLLDAFEESEFEGLLTVLGRLSGTRAAPDVTGRLSLADGEIKWKPLGLELDSLAVSAELVEQELRLHSASGRTKKGHVRMQGALPLTGDPEAGVKLEAEVTGLSIRTPEAVKAAGDAKLTVSGTIAEPVLEGKLTITEASIPLPEKGRKEMVKIPPDDPWLKGTRVAPGSRPPLTGQKLPIALNVTIDVPRNLWLRNDDINVEIGGTLKLTTPDGSLRVEGDLKTREGSVRMLNRRFQVTKGTVNFFGTRTLLPTIDIEAETQVRDNLVKIHLTGTVEEPKLDFASEPSHTESDIVSLLLFGRTSGELSSGETNFVQEQAGTVAASYVSAQLEREVGQKLKLDVLEIQAAEGNERVAVGKYVSSNTLLRAYQEMGTESYGGVAVEHALSNEFDVEVTADDRGQSGIDLLWKRGD